MSVIKLLPEHLINQIAAGEVIERPASVVKELLENSLDAGAKKIVIEIENGGMDLIKVSDDGCGMDRSDAEMSFGKHATSKISVAEDLFNIHSLGFRGEALASIASVAKVLLQTKQKGAVEGTSVICEGSKILGVDPAGIPEGTQIEVRDLFYNTPARKKYIKNEGTEYTHILNMVTSVALAFPKINFKLVKNGKVFFDLIPTDDNFVRIRELLGKGFADDLIPVFYGHSKIKLSGFIGKPSAARSSKGNQYLFVNNREIKSSSLSYAVKQSFYSLIPKEKYPVFLLFFDVDPTIVDVNVHPRKLEVRFEDEKEIFKIILGACSKSLENHVLSPVINNDKIDFNVDRVHQSAISFEADKKAAKNNLGPKSAGENVTYYRVSASRMPTTDDALEYTEEMLKNENASGEMLNDRVNGVVDTAKNGNENCADTIGIRGNEVGSGNRDFCEVENHNCDVGEKKSSDWASDIIPLAQLNNSYILCEDKDGLLIIDQHAAHERIRYTEIVSEFEQKTLNIQPLLSPVQLELNYTESNVLTQNLELIGGFGFEIEPFGGNTFNVCAVPAYLAVKDHNIEKTIMGLLDDINNQAVKGDYTARKERALTFMACRSAVKFGDKLSMEEMKSLIKRLQDIELPYTCPHGRPTMIRMNYEELEKRFGRRK